MPYRKGSNNNKNKGSEKNNSNNNAAENGQQRKGGSSSKQHNMAVGINPDFLELEFNQSTGTSNFYEFKTSFTNFAFKKYFDMAKTFKDNSVGLYFPPEIKRPVVERDLFELDEDGNFVVDENGDPVP